MAAEKGLELAAMTAVSRRPLDVDGRLHASRQGQISSEEVERGGSCILARVDLGRLVDWNAFGAALILCKHRGGTFGLPLARV